MSPRQGQILSLVEQLGFVRVDDLAARFGVSTVTVRSDLSALESHGRLRRVAVRCRPACCAPSSGFESATFGPESYARPSSQSRTET